MIEIRRVSKAFGGLKAVRGASLMGAYLYPPKDAVATPSGQDAGDWEFTAKAARHKGARRDSD